MVEVDPSILIAVAAAVVGILLFTVLGGSKGKKSREEEPVKTHSKSSHSSHSAPAPAPVAAAPVSTPAAAPVATAAKKKKSKPKKAKAPKQPENKFESLATSSANEGEDEADDDDSVASDAIIPSKNAQALLKKSKVDAKAAAEAKAKPETKEEEKKKEEPKKEVKKPETKKVTPPKKGGKKVTVVTETETKPVPAAAPAPVVEAPKAVEKTPESDLEVAPAAVPFDGWAVVEDKRKSKPKKADSDDEASPDAPEVEEVKADEPQEPPAPVVETVTEEFVVDAKKLGLLIGPKGITKIAIQEASGATINMPKTEKESSGNVTISVTGPAEAVKKALHASNELIAKGYATLIAADDFQESYVAVHHKYLPDIIGKAGSVIRALNNHTGVKITVPAAAKTPGPDGRIPKVKIGLAGQREKVSLTRALIKELTKYYVTPITHPGQTYAELDIPKSYYNYIIGSKGSEIKHIQNNYKVSVHIPDADSVNPNIVVVGTPEAVEQTKKHIEKVIERVDAAQVAREAAAAAAGIKLKGSSENSAAVANGAGEETAKTNGKNGVAAPPGMVLGGGGKPTWANGSNKARPPVPEPTAEEEEAWTREFLPPNSAFDIAAILPAGAKYSTTAPVAAPAPIGSQVQTDANPTPSGLPIPEPKQPVNASAWNNIPNQW